MVRFNANVFLKVKMQRLSISENLESIFKAFDLFRWKWIKFVKKSN